MPKINHPNIGEVVSTGFLEGIITKIYYEDDTCDLTLAGIKYTNIPIFYNCSNTSELRSNGALYSAAEAFSIGDIVITQVESLTSQSVVAKRVIGFKEGLKPCGCNCLTLANVQQKLSSKWVSIPFSDNGTSLYTIPTNLGFENYFIGTNLANDKVKLSMTGGHSSTDAGLMLITLPSMSGYYLPEFIFSYSITYTGTPGFVDGNIRFIYPLIDYTFFLRSNYPTPPSVGEITQAETCMCFVNYFIPSISHSFQLTLQAIPPFGEPSILLGPCSLTLEKLKIIKLDDSPNNALFTKTFH